MSLFMDFWGYVNQPMEIGDAVGVMMGSNSALNKTIYRNYPEPPAAAPPGAPPLTIQSPGSSVYLKNDGNAFTPGDAMAIGQQNTVRGYTAFFNDILGSPADVSNDGQVSLLPIAIALGGLAVVMLWKK